MATSTEVTAKAFYDRKRISKNDLKRLVADGKLSQAAYKRITGETYKA